MSEGGGWERIVEGGRATARSVGEEQGWGLISGLVEEVATWVQSQGRVASSHQIPRKYLHLLTNLHHDLQGVPHTGLHR